MIRTGTTSDQKLNPRSLRRAEAEKYRLSVVVLTFVFDQKLTHTHMRIQRKREGEGQTGRQAGRQTERKCDSSNGNLEIEVKKKSLCHISTKK